MEKLKQIPAAPKRLICFLLALICMLGLLPNTAFAAGPNSKSSDSSAQSIISG